MHYILVAKQGTKLSKHQFQIKLMDVQIFSGGLVGAFAVLVCMTFHLSDHSM